jgi:hypothetical protein
LFMRPIEQEYEQSASDEFDVDLSSAAKDLAETGYANADPHAGQIDIDLGAGLGIGSERQASELPELSNLGSLTLVELDDAGVTKDPSQSTLVNNRGRTSSLPPLAKTRR